MQHSFLYSMLLFALPMFAQQATQTKKTEIKSFYDSLFQTFPNTLISDIEFPNRVTRVLVTQDTTTKNTLVLGIGNAANGAKSRVKTIILNEKSQLVLQKESTVGTRKGVLDASEIIDCGNDWAVFNSDEFYIEVFLISKKDGSITKFEQYDPKLMSNQRYFKHQNKLYLYTFDNKNYLLYQLEQDKITLVRKDKLPEIPKFNFEKQLKDVRYIRDYRHTKFSESAANCKAYTIQNKLIFTFDEVPKSENQLLLLTIDLTTGQLTQSLRNYPSVLTSEKKAKQQYTSFLASDGTLFLSAIGEKDFIISVQKLDNAAELKRLSYTKKEGFLLKNSPIYNDQSNHNFWTGKQQRKVLNTLVDNEFWDLILKSGLTIMAIPTVVGYDITCGNYVYTEVNEGNSVAVGLMFGAVGAGIVGGVSANKTGTDSQYFYTRLDTVFEPIKNIDLPTDLTRQFKVFDYNTRFKFRTYFRLNNKNAFMVYHPESQKLMITTEQ
jgi:hypothetical protein